MARWLRKAYGVGHEADSVDIAAVPDRRRSAQELGQASQRQALSPLLVALLCEAAVACGTALDLGRPTVEESWESTLDTALILSARYLSATARYAAIHGANPLADMSGAAVDRAVATIRQFGSLAQIGEPESPPLESLDAESVSTQALALLAYFRLSPVSTAAIVHARGYLPGAP